MFRRYLHSTHIHIVQIIYGTLHYSVIVGYFVEETKQNKNCIVEAHKIYFLPVFTNKKLCELIWLELFNFPW